MPTSDRKPASDASAPKVSARPMWQWAADTARLAMVTTSQLIRKIDISGLSIEGEEPPKPKHGGKPGAPAARVAAPTGSAARTSGGGFDPYNKKTLPRSPAARKPVAPVARAPVSWWRRVFQRS
ncbi:MAG TPA: hypothetical protein VGL28_02500 [Steroidobacteraceae bacterium]